MARKLFSAYSVNVSVLLHVVLLVVAVGISMFPGCRKKELVVPIDFTVVLPEMYEQDEEPEEKSEPEQVAPPPEPDDLPSLPDPVTVKKDPPKKDPPKKDPPKKDPPPKKPEKKPPPKKDPPKKDPPKKDPPKKPFVKGKRVEGPKPPPDKPKQDFTKLPRASNKPAVDKPLSRQELLSALNAGARVGTRNQVPQGEQERCFLLIKQALYQSWEQPSANGVRPAQLEIKLDNSGRIVSYVLVQSSGDPFFDKTVKAAAARTMPIRGLSLAFIKQYETLRIEFKVE